MHETHLMTRAQAYGLDLTIVTRVLTVFGPDVLALTVELLQNGYSKEWVLELIEKFGTDLARFLAEAQVKMTAMKAAAPVIEGERVDNFNDPSSDATGELIKQLLPLILKYWPQLLAIVLKLLSNKQA